MKLELPLVGDSIFLRALNSEDATSQYLSWLYDLDVIRYLEIRFSTPRTVEDLARYINSANDSDDILMLGMFLRTNSRHIGNIKLGPIDRNHSTSDIGLLIGERAEWGKGHGSAAIQLLADHAFANLALAKLTAGCYEKNEGSLRAFVNAGFVEEGRRIAQYLVEGKRLDGIMLGKANPLIELSKA
jgi:ribosomal-protein-alanine N-acetyltransferase